MKLDLATIHQQLDLIQASDVFLSPALGDYYQAMSINIEACGGKFHEVVVQSHNCLARVYGCYIEHTMSSKEVMGDRRVVRLGGDGGSMGESIPLNNYIKSAEHYLAYGICQSNHEKFLLQKIWILSLITYPCLKTLHLTKTNNCLNTLDLPCMMPRKS